MMSFVRNFFSPPPNARDKQLRTATVWLAVPSVFLVIIGVLSPHLFEGHMWIDSRNAAALFLLVNFSALFFLFFRYVRELRRIEEERRRAAALLLDSYRQMGVANRKVDVISEFVNAVRHVEMEKPPRAVIKELLDYLVNSVCRSDWGVVRFVRRDKLRTLTEWISGDFSRPAVSLSNKEIMAVETDGFLPGGFRCIVSDSGTPEVRCAFVFPEAEGNLPDAKFTATLLNQIYVMAVYLGLVTVKKQKKTLLLS
jgi:hypothetical protein